MHIYKYLIIYIYAYVSYNWSNDWTEWADILLKKPRGYPGCNIG